MILFASYNNYLTKSYQILIIGNLIRSFRVCYHGNHLETSFSLDPKEVERVTYSKQVRALTYNSLAYSSGIIGSQCPTIGLQLLLKILFLGSCM